MKFLVAVLIACQAFLMISGQQDREVIFGDPIGIGSRFSGQGSMVQAAPLNGLLNATQRFESDGHIWSVRVIDLNVNRGIPTIAVEDGGQGQHHVLLRATNTVNNINANYRVEIYAGVGMAKASTIFLAIAFFVSYLLK